MSIQYHQVDTYDGAPAVGYVLFTGNSADTETVTINARVYEFDTNAMITGNVAVDISGGNNAAQSTAAFVAAVNGDASRVVDALDGGGNIAVLVARAKGATGNYTLAGTLANGAVSAATMTQGAAANRIKTVSGSYAITAQDVTTLAVTLGTSEIPIAAVHSTTQPVLIGAQARTAAGAVISLVNGIFPIAQVNANFWKLGYVEPAGGALLAATNVISFQLSVVGG